MKPEIYAFLTLAIATVGGYIVKLAGLVHELWQGLVVVYTGLALCILAEKRYEEYIRKREKENR